MFARTARADAGQGSKGSWQKRAAVTP
eukprot:COSAG02_NODE_56089_length_287_cov_0.819149_2_plen_26_part_01